MTSCRICNFIRGFLLLAGGLLIMMAYFAWAGDEPAVQLPGPMAFGLAVPAIGIPSFIIKYRRYKAQRKG